MFLDSSLNFSTAQAITATAASTSIYDITGAGSGVAPALVYGASVFGADMGNGDGVAIPYVYVQVQTAFVSGGGATLQFQIQAAIDNGSNAPGTYTTILQTDVFLSAALTINKLFFMPLPIATLGQAPPRFYRLNYVVATSTFSAGKITSGLCLNPPSSLTAAIQTQSNYTSV